MKAKDWPYIGSNMLVCACLGFIMSNATTNRSAIASLAVGAAVGLLLSGVVLCIRVGRK